MRVQVNHSRNREVYFPVEFLDEKDFEEFIKTLHACEHAIPEDYGRKRYKQLVVNLEKRAKKVEYMEGIGIRTCLYQNEMSDFVTCIDPLLSAAECFETIIKNGDDELIEKIKNILEE